MNVQVTNDVRIHLVDGGVYQIERRFTVESGKHAGEERWSAFAFHGSLKAAAESLFTRHVHLLIEHPEKVESLRSLVRAIDNAERRIASAVDRATASSAA